MEENASRLFLVSFPRSGQHYTETLIRQVSGVDEYCELYTCRVASCPAKKFPTKLRIPCYSGRRIQKNHDFELDLPIARVFRYAVLYRKPLYSIQSLYEWHLRKHGGAVITVAPGQLQKLEDSAQAWQAFALHHSVYWRRFIKKWCRVGRRPNHISTFKYEDLVTSKSEIARLLAFCLPHVHADRRDEMIKQQLSRISSGARKLRNIENFRYFDRRFVDRIHKVIGAKALKLANYDAIF